MHQAFTGQAKRNLPEKTAPVRRRKKKHIQKPLELDSPAPALENIPIQQPDCGCRRSITICDPNKEPPVDKPDPVDNRNMSFNPDEQGSFCFHLGILIFAPFLNRLEKKGLHYIRQWLLAVMLGCQNIEQSKELNYTSLETIIGKAHKTLRSQRLSLKDASTKANTERIFQFNAELLKVNRQNDFYYDPHTKHYSGHLKILSTWCPSVRLADKGINMDYIHTALGHPVYFNTNDNFYDLRERFWVNIKKFRSLFDFDKESTITHIIDRGIYSMDVFADMIQDPNTHIITWEKGYKKDQWDKGAPYGNGSVEKRRNNKKDVKLVHYRYQERQWDKHESMRQIIVRIYDKNWKTLIEVSILTDDKNRPADQIIELMLKRWVQENDFKYTIKHFGLNQITSYAFTDYKALRDKIEDKLYICSEHKTLTKEIHKIRNKLKTALLRKYKFEAKHKNPDEKLSAKEQERKTKTWNTVSQLNASLSELEQQRNNTAKFVSKIDELVGLGYNKLDTNTKDFMDAIKMLARNMFYISFQPFKEKYDNYRDDHVLFRHLTRSSGTIGSSADGIKVTLCPQMEYQPKTKRMISQVLDEINEMNPEIPDGSHRRIELILKN